MNNLERVSLSKTARLETQNTEATIPPNEEENYFLSEKIMFLILAKRTF